MARRLGIVCVLVLSLTPVDAQSPPVRSDSIAPAPAETLFWNLADPRAGVEQLMEQMTEEQTIAQVLLVGWPSAEPSAEILRWINERGLGGVKVFGWNGNDAATLAESLSRMQRASIDGNLGIPLFTATDQEGGWVRHIKDRTSHTPGNMAIGASGLPHDAFWSAYFIGLELRELGINMNFAPTVDVYVNPDAHVIGPRAFSSDPIQTGILGTAFYRGLQRAGVIATAKHFPGHGNAGGDSHGTLPVIEDSWETVWNRDLVPYRMLVREGVPAILSGHLSFPEASGTEAPASISPFFKIHVLRERLGFEGLVITDDLYMEGALEYARQQNWSFPQLCVEAIRAGNDMVLLSQTPDFDGDIWNALLNEYRTDPGFRARIRESAARILSIKLEYLLSPTRVPLFPQVAGQSEPFTNGEGAAFFAEQAGRSVTVIKDGGFPIPNDGSVEVLLAGNDPDFIREGQARFPNASLYRFDTGRFFSSSEGDRRDFPSVAEQYDVVVALVSDPASMQIVDAARGIDTPIVVFSILTPVYLANLPWVDGAIAAYGWGKESYVAGFAALRGDFRPSGTLPIDLDVMRSAQ